MPQRLLIIALLYLSPAASETTYKYEYHNVLLNHFAYKEFHLTLPCKSLTTDDLRSGHVVFNLYCERRRFQVKITAPSSELCQNAAGDAGQQPRLYINLRSISLDGSETLELSDPLSPVKKHFTSTATPYMIEQGLQSFGQLLTTGSTALLEYTPPTQAQPCHGRGEDDSTKLIELEYVLVAPSAPSHIENFRFTYCPALQGYIPTGVLCDQYSDDRPIGCPLSISPVATDLDPADGQDRQNANCYPVVFGKGERDQAVLDLVDGSMVAVVPPILVSSNASSLILPRLTVLLHMCIVAFLATSTR